MQDGCPPTTFTRSEASVAAEPAASTFCTFGVKLQGYRGAVVFNRTEVDGCETLINMLVEAGIPAVFVSRTDGFRILGASLTGYTCSESGAGTPAPPAGTDGASVDMKAVFDGWGYVHLFDAATFKDLDQYSIPEAHDPAHAIGFGDLSVHEAATDPDADRRTSPTIRVGSGCCRTRGRSWIWARITGSAPGEVASDLACSSAARALPSAPSAAAARPASRR